MGKFVKYNESWIEDEIEKQLSEIVKVIREEVGENKVKSIILRGGFGRGEGSVLINGGSIVPLKDYDILVIVGTIPKDEKVLSIVKKVHEKIGIPNPKEKDFHFHSFLIDIGFTTKKHLSLYPDISTYEMKEASYLLWGEDIRKNIQLEVKDIPLSSPLRFLFEKCTGLIGHFSEEYIYKKNNIINKISLIYECYKTYIEICTALCFLMNCFEPYFEKRMKVFMKNFEKRLPSLYKELPDLPNMIKKCTEFKLRPNLERINEQPVELWFKTRNDLLVVLKYFLELYTETKMNDWVASFDEISNALSWLYHKWVPRVLLSKTGLYRTYLVKLAILLLNLGLNWGYNIRMLKKYRRFKPKMLMRIQSPIVKIFLTSPLILLSLESNGDINKKYFEEAVRRLKEVSPLNGNIISWNDLRQHYLSSYYLYKGPK
jgi:hypothetical protein